MLIDIYCLKGNPQKIEQAEIVGSLIRKQVLKFDDILDLIAGIYQDANSPFPYIGNVHASTNGLVVPSVGNYFFWVILSKTSDVIVLDDFGAALTNNRISVLNNICTRAAGEKNSIWDFASKWSLTHHKTSTERLVSYYVYFVKNHFEADDYASWLKADGYFVQAPFDEYMSKYHYTGIDMSSLDSSDRLSGMLETAIFRSIPNNRISQALQKEIHRFVSEYMKYRKLPSDTTVSEKSGRKGENVISTGRMESLKNDAILNYSRR